MKIKGYSELDDFVLITEKDGKAWLWGFRKVKLEKFTSIEQAQKVYPEVKVNTDVVFKHDDLSVTEGG